MRIKKRKHSKEEMIGARVNKEEFNKIKLNANLYTEGNLSEWIVYAALNCKPNKTDLEN